METYETVKKAALALPAIQQDGLLSVLAAEHAKRKASEQAEKATGWKQKAWKAAAVIATLVAGVLGVMASTGCTYSSSQVAEDGTTTTRYWTLDAATARDLIKLYGVPEIPSVKVSK